ncbi:peptidase domain-containing ABC transporter [Salipaludibacillus agaradhaerens]|uniref:peptidase domain-containing ABC transporter n=1 Tax=Salipaludibacillus agaradhaerens TaxID=76935 RepID=UPI0009974F9B|nr:peptidase domain-containing ABC transporter [Salipaludibacillus agaradhaerens]
MKLLKKKIPVILQKSNYDCGIICFAMIMSWEEGYRVDPRKLKQDRKQIGREGTDLLYLKTLAKTHGYDLKAFKALNLTEKIAENALKCPMIVHWKNNHFVIIEKIKDNTITIIDPAAGRKTILAEEFERDYSGVAIKLTKKDAARSHTKLKGVSLVNKIRKYLLQEKKMLVYIILLSFVFQFLNLITPFLTQYVIDAFMDNKQTAIRLDLLAILGVCVTILFFGLSILRMYWIIKLQVCINKGLTNQFIKKIFSLPMNFFEVNSSGDIATRINNIAVIREIISRLASTLILDISLLIVFCGVMLYYSPTLSLLVFIGAGLQVFFTTFLLPRIEMFTKQEVNSQANFQSQLVEILRSMTFIKTVGDTKSIEMRMNQLFNDQIGHFSKRMNTSALLGGVSNSINLSLPLFVLIIGIAIGMQNGLTIGTIVAFATIAGRFMAPLGSIIGSLESVKMVEEMVDRVEYVLQEEDEQNNVESHATFNPATDDITFEHVHFSYDNGEDILSNISLVIHPKEKITLIGKTGSGKSTLFKLIAGLYPATKGSIYFGPHNIKDINLMKIRENIGFIVQDVSLFNETIMNNIKYFNDLVSDDAAIQAAKDACIHDDIERLPMGYHTVIGENGVSLSGGQRQRIAIARVLAKDPKILLIDEGTSNLDKATEKEILFNLYKRDMTVVSITHRTDSISEYESIYELNNGMLIQLKSRDKKQLV